VAVENLIPLFYAINLKLYSRVITVQVHTFSNKLGAISKFWVPQQWQDASSKLRIYKYLAPHKTWCLGFVRPWVAVCITSFNIQKLCMLPHSVSEFHMICTFNIDCSLNSANCSAFIMGMEFVLCEVGSKYTLYSAENFSC
jgi:hypothetical protein